MQLDHHLRQPLSGSKKIYISGELYPDIAVPMREIQLTNGKTFSVYDTSGIYTHADHTIDNRLGLPGVRTEWIAKRDDVAPYQGRSVVPEDNGYSLATKSAEHEAHQLRRTPQRAKAGANITQMHYARRGIITPEMEYVAIRENQHNE